MKYSASFKLQVVKFASDNSNNSAASRKFGIDEKLVRDWRRKIDNIKSLPKTKCADRGRKCQWPELEKKVVEWVEENRKSGLAVTRNLIRLHAKKTAQQMNIDNFLVSSGWCTRFMKRNKLVLRQKTKISQRLPDDLEEKITSYTRWPDKPRPTSGCLFKQAIQGSFTGKMDDLDDEWGKDIHTGWPAPSSISRNSLSMG